MKKFLFYACLIYGIMLSDGYARLIATGQYSDEACWDTDGETARVAICICDTNSFDNWEKCEPYADIDGYTTTNCVIGFDIAAPGSVSLCVPENSDFLHNACQACNCPDGDALWQPYRPGVLKRNIADIYEEYYACNASVDTNYACDAGYYLSSDSDEYDSSMQCTRCPGMKNTDGNLIMGETPKANYTDIYECTLPAGNNQYDDGTGIFIYTSDCSFSGTN